MAHKEHGETAEKAAFQVGWEHAIFKNTITHNLISNTLNLRHRRKLTGRKDNRAIPVNKQKIRGVSRPGNVLCKARRKNCL